MNTNVPNLDVLDQDELMVFWSTYYHGKNYKKLFPEGGKGTKKACEDLANYASNRSTAMACRLRGWVEKALMYEGIADRIYRKLPEFARF